MFSCISHGRAASLLLLIVFFAGCARTGPTASNRDSGTGKAVAEDPARHERHRSGAIAAAASESVGWSDQVSGDASGKQRTASVEQLLAGKISGVDVISLPGGGFSIRMRGASSFAGGGEPLYVIDGFPTQRAGSGLMINPHDIKRIEVLKDVDARALYGSRAANGVVLITTK